MHWASASLQSEGEMSVRGNDNESVREPTPHMSENE
jgi:hypothetical protein